MRRTSLVLLALVASSCNCSSKPSQQPPLTVVITAPAAGATVGADFQVTATVTGARGDLATVLFTLGGTACAQAAASPWTATCTLGTRPDGATTLVATAGDQDTRTATSAPVAITIARPLAVAITAPAASATVTGDFPVAATVTGAGSSAATVTFALSGVACTPSLPSPFGGTCALGAAADGPATVVATATSGTLTAKSPPVTITIARALSLELDAALEGSIWLERAPIVLGVQAVNALSLEILVDGAVVKTLSAPPFQPVLPPFSLAPGFHRIDATARAGAKLARATTRTISVGIFPYFLANGPVQEKEDNRFTIADGRYYNYGAYADAGVNDVGDLYYVKLPGGHPVGPYPRAHVPTATADLAGHFYFWQLNSGGGWDLALGRPDGGLSLVAPGAEQPGVPGRLMESDDGTTLTWSAIDGGFQALSDAGPVLLGQTFRAYARTSSVALDLTLPDGGVQTGEVVGATFQPLGSRCTGLDDYLFNDGGMFAICDPQVPGLGGTAMAKGAGQPARAVGSSCPTADHFPGYGAPYFLCDNDGGSGNLYYLPVAANPPLLISPVSPANLDLRDNMVLFSNAGTDYAYEGNHVVSLQPFDGGTVGFSNTHYLEASFPDAGTCGMYRILDTNSGQYATVPCDQGDLTQGKVPPDTLLHLSTPDDGRTFDLYYVRGRGPSAVKVLQGLSFRSPVTAISADGAWVLAAYIAAVDSSTPGRVAYAKADGTAATVIQYVPGIAAAGVVYAGFSLDGKTLFYVSDIAPSANNWTGTLHLVPLAGGADQTVTVGGPISGAPQLLLAFASAGPAGVASSSSGAIAFNGGSSAPIAVSGAALFSQPADARHLYLSDPARSIDVNLETLTATTAGGPFLTGAYGSYASGIDGGGLVRFPDRDGGPTPFATGTPIVSSQGDLFEDEDTYIFLSFNNSDAGTDRAKDFNLLVDQCGPYDYEDCHRPQTAIGTLNTFP